jgi:hypothetical protein
MFIHLVSLTKGAMRMIVVSQVDRFGEMRGIVTTIHKHGAMLVPVATPIVYAKRETFDGSLGDITKAKSPAFDAYRKSRRHGERRLQRGSWGRDRTAYFPAGSRCSARAPRYARAPLRACAAR